MKALNLFLITTSLMFVSCASTYKEFRTKEVNYKEGIAIGKINIKYNGNKYNKECAACFYSIKGNGGPCQMLTDEGYVFIAVLKGETSLGRIQCKDTSVYHYNPIGAVFNVGDDVTYFGEVNIDWENEGGFKATDMFGAIGAAISESKIYGIFNMSVQIGKMQEVVKLFQEQTKQEKIKVVKNIMSVGK
jgi:hypothetical protein